MSHIRNLVAAFNESFGCATIAYCMDKLLTMPSHMLIWKVITSPSMNKLLLSSNRATTVGFRTFGKPITDIFRSPAAIQRDLVLENDLLVYESPLFWNLKRLARIRSPHINASSPVRLYLLISSVDSLLERKHSS